MGTRERAAADRLGRRHLQEEIQMGLIVVYVALVIVGELIAYAIGLGVRQVLPAYSLPVFLFMFFFMFWASWLVAVRLTSRWDAPAVPAGK
jgi:hypothetical protein